MVETRGERTHDAGKTRFPKKHQAFRAQRESCTDYRRFQCGVAVKKDRAIQFTLPAKEKRIQTAARTSNQLNVSRPHNPNALISRTLKIEVTLPNMIVDQICISKSFWR